jgi:putative redox protein
MSAAAVRVDWAGEGRFDATRATGGPSIRMDTHGEAGPSPVDTLLAALASCVSIDVVEILAKRRTPASSLTVHVRGERVETTPRRLRHVSLGFVIAGDGIERAHAERAIDLALTKYCSVRDSLREDIGVEWTLTLEGAAGDARE